MRTISNYLEEIPRTDYQEPIKRILLDYMSRKEHRYGVSSARIKDFVTGEYVENICRIMYNDGEFEWRSEEVYLVEKYDMKVSDEFIVHVLESENSMAK